MIGMGWKSWRHVVDFGLEKGKENGNGVAEVG